MIDPAVHTEYIDRQAAVVDAVKVAAVDAAVGSLTPRLVLVDIDRARDAFLSALVKSTLPAFRRVAAIGREFAEVKNP